jgi:hypothetical protein
VLPLAQLAADTDGPILTPKGNVTINGKKTTRPTALFSGDTIQTTDDSSASMTALGSSMLVSANSLFTYGSNVVEVGCGDVLITTVVKRTSAKVSNLAITPATDIAKFEITRSAGRLQISAHEGAVGINDGTQTTRLDPGKVISFNSVGECLPSRPANEHPLHSETMNASKGKIFGLVAAGGGATGIGIAVSQHGGGNKAPAAISPAVP